MVKKSKNLSGILMSVFPDRNKRNYNRADKGSILIFVLWMLVFLSFLSARYLLHNRAKLVFAQNAFTLVNQDLAVKSVVELFSADVNPISYLDTSHWNKLVPSGVALWVKVDSEAEKLNINSASEFQIRTRVREILGEDSRDKADEITDAILDWRDSDNLVRLNGAEQDFYENNGRPGPANSPFKTLTELLLVKGITGKIFWGSPYASAVSAEREPETGSSSQLESSIAESFTVYKAGTRRISIVIPGTGNSYQYLLVFLEKKNGKWNPVAFYRTILIKNRENFEH